MKTSATETTMAGCNVPETERSNLPNAAKWRRFPKVPNLLQYVRTGTYFARTKVKGKTIRLSLLKDGEESISFTTANLVRFLAYSGCRISEARQVTWQDVDWERGELKVRNAKRSLTSSEHAVRFMRLRG